MRGLSHRVEVAEFTFWNTKARLHPLHALPQTFVCRRQEGNAKHDHCAAVVTIKVNALGDFATGNGHENGSTPNVTCPSIVRKGDGRLVNTLRLDKNQFVLREFL